MELLGNAIVIILLQYINVSALKTLNIDNVISQLYLNEAVQKLFLLKIKPTSDFTGKIQMFY